MMCILLLPGHRLAFQPALECSRPPRRAGAALRRRLPMVMAVMQEYMQDTGEGLLLEIRDQAKGGYILLFKGMAMARAMAMR